MKFTDHKFHPFTGVVLRTITRLYIDHHYVIPGYFYHLQNEPHTILITSVLSSPKLLVTNNLLSPCRFAHSVHLIHWGHSMQTSVPSFFHSARHSLKEYPCYSISLLFITNILLCI